MVELVYADRQTSFATSGDGDAESDRQHDGAVMAGPDDVDVWQIVQKKEAREATDQDWHGTGEADGDFEPTDNLYVHHEDQHIFKASGARRAHYFDELGQTAADANDLRTQLTMDPIRARARQLQMAEDMPARAMMERNANPDPQNQAQATLSTVYVTVTETTGSLPGESSTGVSTGPLPTSTAMTLTPTTSVVTVLAPTPVNSRPPSAQPSPLPTSLVMSSVVVLTSTVFSAAPSGVPAIPGGATGQTSATLPDGGHTGGITHPNNEQLKTVWVGAVIFFALLLTWNMFMLRDVLYPWKMWVNVIHESCHVVVGILTGAKVYSVTIDPDKGPISGMTGGYPLLILSAGYLGSIATGAGLIMASFDTTASKIAALCTYPWLIICFWFGRTWARIRTLICMGLSIGMWFIDHGEDLRWYILFLGVMNAFYVLWDCIDDFFFRKANESDAALFARLSPPTVHAWMFIWLSITAAFVTLAILGGLHFFDKSAEAQRLDQLHFLPT